MQAKEHKRKCETRTKKHTQTPQIPGFFYYLKKLNAKDEAKRDFKTGQEGMPECVSAQGMCTKRHQCSGLLLSSCAVSLTAEDGRAGSKHAMLNPVCSLPRKETV